MTTNNKDGTSNTDIPKPIQIAMAKLDGDMHKAYEFASIFGYTGSSPAVPTRLQDGSLAPATQAEAIERIETGFKTVVSLEKEKSDLESKVVELEGSSKAITDERDAIKAELEAIKKVESDAKKVELEKLQESLKKVDEKGVLLENIKDLDVDKQITLVKTYLERFDIQKNVDSSDIKLTRDNAGGANDAIVNKASEELFGTNVEGLVNKMIGKPDGGN